MSLSRYVPNGVMDYSRKGSLRWRLRQKRLLPLLSLIRSVHEQEGRVTILDIGGTRKYWALIPEEFLVRHRVHVTIVNVPGTPLAPEEEHFSYTAADGCDLSRFADRSFHIAHSNSVLEHVGDWGRMVRYAGELRRVAARYFVQTPSYWFPIEPHCLVPFFHWLPRPLQVVLVMRFGLGHWSRQSTVDGAVRTIDSSRMVDGRMFRALFADAEVMTERFLLLPKSYVAVRRGIPEAGGADRDGS